MTKNRLTPSSDGVGRDAHRLPNLFRLKGADGQTASPRVADREGGLSRIEELTGRVNAIRLTSKTSPMPSYCRLTDTYRRRLHDGVSMTALLPEAFATVREASRRTLNGASATTCR